MAMKKGTQVEITGPMRKAAALSANGLSTQQIADELGVNRSTVSRWFNREDMKAMRNAALTEVVAAMIPRAYAVLNAQLNHSNPWVAQGAARELIRLFNLQQGTADASVVVTFGSMPKPGAPGSAGHMAESLPDGDTIEADFAE